MYILAYDKTYIFNVMLRHNTTVIMIIPFEIFPSILYLYLEKRNELTSLIPLFSFLVTEETGEN